MIRLTIVFLILTSCTFIQNDNFKKNTIFDESLNFEQFKAKLIDYGDNSNFPNINENK
tara:strand:+ start:296 stop:469 length:174 start_codon:yes stop_codon:yes gene_type:complete